jgi:Spy/CpxP family protein refolding chaperone
MKLQNALFASILLAGGLLAVPAFAADNAGDSTLSSGTRTDVVAEGPDGGRPEWKGEHKARMTDDQLIQMAALKDKFLSSTATQRTQLMSLHRQLKSALAKPEISRAEVLGIQGQMNSIHDDLATKKLNNKLDFIALLTPEQKEHFRHHMLVSNAFGGHDGHGGGGAGGACGGGGHGHHGGGGHHKMGGPGGPGGPGGGPRVGFDQGQGPGPVAFDAPEGFMGPEGPDGQ